MKNQSSKTKGMAVNSFPGASLPLFAAMEKITPERAAHLLKSNTNNRAVSRDNVNYIKKQLLEGKWMLNGECIKIAADGEILDGQHRLIACQESGIPIETMIMFNVGKEAKHTMDTGRNRSASDVLSFVFPNKKYITAISAAARFVLAFNKGQFGSAAGGISVRKGYASDNTDIMNFVKNTPEFTGFVEKSLKIRNNGDRIMEAKLFVGLHWIIAQKHGEGVADKFFSLLSTGIGVTEQDAVFVVRKKLLSGILTNAKEFRFTPSEVLWGVIKAFTYFVANKKATKLVFDGQPIEF